MEDELRLSLLIIGTFIIVGVLAHGMWKIRKNNQSEQRRERVEPGNWDDSQWNDDEARDPLISSGDEDDFDELGVGKVRVVSEQRHPETATSEASTPSDTENQATTPASSQDDSAADDKPASEKLYGSVVTNPKPHMQSGGTGTGKETPDEQDIPAPPGFLLKEDDHSEPGIDSASGQASAHAAAANTSSDSAISAQTNTDTEVDDFALDSPSPEGGQPAPDSTRHRRQSSTRQRQEPNFGDDQMRIDFDEPSNSDAQATQAADELKAAGEQTAARQPASANEPAQQEVLILNVKASEDKAISGAALLPLLLTLGFKFGDQDIFHRHVNSNGKGPVLFSLANMFKPGSFDIDNLEVFSTQGVSLFMILPIEGDAHQVFNMMHNAARKIADEFDAQILDGRRSVLTKQGLQQYIEKIREFERRRMVARH